MATTVVLYHLEIYSVARIEANYPKDSSNTTGIVCHIPVAVQKKPAANVASDMWEDVEIFPQDLAATRVDENLSQLDSQGDT